MTDLQKDCERKSRTEEPLSIKVCIDLLEACYLANEHPYPMGLGLRQACKYLSESLIVQKRPDSLSASEYTRLVEWIKNPDRKEAIIAFTASACRDAARAIEQSGVLIVQKRVEELEALAYMEGEPGHETTWKEEVLAFVELDKKQQNQIDELKKELKEAAINLQRSQEKKNGVIDELTKKLSHTEKVVEAAKIHCISCPTTKTLEKRIEDYEQCREAGLIL